jgi:hypothetical protein
MEMLSDYEFELKYLPGKANKVADALSSKDRMKPLKVRSMRLDVWVDLMDRLKQAQASTLEEGNSKNEEMMKTVQQLVKGKDGLLRMGTRIWVPMYGGLRDLILEEAHKSKYLMHPGVDKMYHILKDHFAQNKKRHCGVCGEVPHMSPSEGGTPKSFRNAATT